MNTENKITVSKDLPDIKTMLHRAIDAISVEEIDKAGGIPQIVQRIGKDCQGNSQSVTVMLYFDLRTFNTNNNSNRHNFQSSPAV